MQYKRRGEATEGASSAWLTRILCSFFCQGLTATGGAIAAFTEETVQDILRQAEEAGR